MGGWRRMGSGSVLEKDFDFAAWEEDTRLRIEQQQQQQEQEQERGWHASLFQRVAHTVVKARTPAAAAVDTAPLEQQDWTAAIVPITVGIAVTVLLMVLVVLSVRYLQRRRRHQRPRQRAGDMHPPAREDQQQQDLYQVTFDAMLRAAPAAQDVQTALRLASQLAESMPGRWPRPDTVDEVLHTVRHLQSVDDDCRKIKSCDERFSHDSCSKLSDRLDAVQMAKQYLRVRARRDVFAREQAVLDFDLLTWTATDLRTVQEQIETLRRRDADRAKEHEVLRLLTRARCEQEHGVRELKHFRDLINAGSPEPVPREEWMTKQRADIAALEEHFEPLERMLEDRRRYEAQRVLDTSMSVEALATAASPASGRPATVLPLLQEGGTAGQVTSGGTLSPVPSAAADSEDEPEDAAGSSPAATVSPPSASHDRRAQLSRMHSDGVMTTTSDRRHERLASWQAGSSALGPHHSPHQTQQQLQQHPQQAPESGGQQELVRMLQYRDLLQRIDLERRRQSDMEHTLHSGFEDKFTERQQRLATDRKMLEKDVDHRARDRAIEVNDLLDDVEGTGVRVEAELKLRIRRRFAMEYYAMLASLGLEALIWNVIVSVDWARRRASPQTVWEIVWKCLAAACRSDWLCGCGSQCDTPGDSVATAAAAAAAAGAATENAVASSPASMLGSLQESADTVGFWATATGQAIFGMARSAISSSSSSSSASSSSSSAAQPQEPKLNAAAGLAGAANLFPIPAWLWAWGRDNLWSEGMCCVTVTILILPIAYAFYTLACRIHPFIGRFVLLIIMGMLYHHDLQDMLHAELALLVIFVATILVYGYLMLFHTAASASKATRELLGFDWRPCAAAILIPATCAITAIVAAVQMWLSLLH